MQTFKNKNFVKRDYECTNIVACQAEVSPGKDWIACDDSILDKLMSLYVLGGVRYFGYL